MGRGEIWPSAAGLLIPDLCFLSPDGAIAQLGERLLCKQEVVGSIPSGSTNSFDFRNAQPRLVLLERKAALAQSQFQRQPRCLLEFFYIVKRGLT